MLCNLQQDIKPPSKTNKILTLKLTKIAKDDGSMMGVVVHLEQAGKNPYSHK